MPEIKKHDVLSIRFDESLGMFVLYMNDMPMMKNKLASTLSKKLAKWLQSQGR